MELVLEDPLPRNDMMSGGQATRSQVLLLIRVPYSSTIAVRQLGSARAARKDFGIGEMGAAT
jgi:hypothetical protein